MPPNTGNTSSTNSNVVRRRKIIGKLSLLTHKMLRNRFSGVLANIYQSPTEGAITMSNTCSNDPLILQPFFAQLRALRSDRATQPVPAYALIGTGLL